MNAVRVGSGRVDNFVYTTGRVGSPTQRVGSGPEKSDPWSTLRKLHVQKENEPPKDYAIP